MQNFLTNNRSLYIFLSFMQRDCYVYFKRITFYVINFCVIYPIIDVITFGYLEPNIFLTDITPKYNTVIFIGCTSLLTLVLAFGLTIDFLADLFYQRYIDYKLSILSPRLILFQRILFTSCFVFLLLLPFFPISKLLLQQLFDTSNTSWPLVAIILFLGSYCLVSFNILSFCLLKSMDETRKFWMRINFPLFILGGLWVPMYVFYQFWPPLWYLALLNPLTYISEGLRQAIVGGPEFLPFIASFSALTGLSITFTFVAFYLFKKRVDHI